MSDETPVSVTMQKDGDVAVVIVNNPPVNALSWHVRQGLKDHFEAALADDGKHQIRRSDLALMDADVAYPVLDDQFAPSSEGHGRS